MRRKFIASAFASIALAAVTNRAVFSSSEQQKITIPDCPHRSTEDFMADLKAVTAESQKNYLEYTSTTNQARAYMEDKRYKEALACYQKAMEIEPTWGALTLRDRAMAYLEMNDASKALADINKAISEEPCDAALYTVRTNALEMLKDYRGALANADALVAHSSDAANFLLRAKVKKELADKTGAIADVRSAVVYQEMHGDDAMDEMDELENLAGHKVERPKPNYSGSMELLQLVQNLIKDERRFSPSFVAELTHLTLKESPVMDHPEIHTHLFSAVEPGYAIERVNLADKEEGMRGVRFTVNRDHICILYEDLVKIFGTPSSVRGDPREFADFQYPWGTLGFHFQQHGFKSVLLIDVDDKPNPHRLSPNPLKPAR